MTITARRYAGASREVESVELASMKAEKLDDEQLLWVDCSVEADELTEVDNALGLDGVLSPLANESRVGVSFGDGTIRLTVAGLESHQKSGRPKPVLVHIVAAPNVVVSAHDRSVLGLEDPIAEVAGDPRFGLLNAATFVSLLLEGMLSGFYSELEDIERGLDETDERALGHEPSDALLGDLVAARHRIAILRRTLAPQREVYASLARPVEGESSPVGTPWPELVNKLERALDAVDSTRDSVLGSFDIVMTRTGQRTNDVMRVLTVVSSVLLPAVVVGGVMGMNFHPTFFDEPSFFFLVVLTMVALAVVTLLFARHRGWL